MSEAKTSNATDRVGVDCSRALPFVSVLMPVRDEAGFIERSVGSVLAQDYPHERMEILIADGMSRDATREIIRSLQQSNVNLRMIDNPGQIVATGLNAALRQAKGEIIVRVDGHCAIAADYLRKCVAHLINDNADAVGGPVETIGESYVARVIATAMSSWFGVGGSAFRIANSTTQFTDTVAFPAYTRSVIDRAGDFDEELVRNQDDEYNYRLRKLGVKILLAADIRSRYFNRGTLPGLWRQYFQYGYWKVRVMQKHPRQMRLRQFGPPLLVAGLLMSLALLPFLSFAGYLLGSITGAYAIASTAASILSAKESKWPLLPLLPITFAILHLAYGAGFLFGLIKFWSRWGNRRSNAPAPAPVIDGGQI